MQADLAAALGIGISALGINPQQAPLAVVDTALSPVKVEIVQTGSGAGAQLGDLVTLHFIVRTIDGKELANTRKRGMPFTVELAQVGTFWHVAVDGLRAGGSVKLRTNTGLFFGKGGVLPIVPPDTIIDAELTLLRIQKTVLAKKEPKS
jgi:FKBP-type peptidyl-prolyl cis-trans isomerase